MRNRTTGRNNRLRTRNRISHKGGYASLRRNKGGRNLGLVTANVEMIPMNIATPLQLNMSLSDQANKPLHLVNVNAKTRGKIGMATLKLNNARKRASITNSGVRQSLKHYSSRNRSRKNRSIMKGGNGNCPSNFSNMQCNKYKTIKCPEGMPSRICLAYKLKQSRLKLPKNIKLNIELAARNLERKKMPEENFVAAARMTFRKPKSTGWSGIPEELEGRHLENIHEYNPELNLGSNTMIWE